MKSKIGISVFISLIVIFAVVLFNERDSNPISYNEFIKMVETGAVESATLSDSSKICFISGGENYETDNPRSSGFKEYLLVNGVTVTESSSGASIIQAFGTIAFFAAGFYFVNRSMNKNNVKSAMALGIEQVPTESAKNVTFCDIAGNTEAKESVADIIDFIREPEKYTKYGARMPKGIIFYGSPGTGKTLMAKAIAGEANVPFFSVSGSDFVQMYVGVGASRIRELFAKAREVEKCVIFIDEIDALGKKRNSATYGGNDERDQTLNALLTEMSGFNDSSGIIVIAATNRLDILDEALLRPGRFDRQIEIGLPDLTARRKIIELYIENKPMDNDVSIEDLARQTVYFSGAMIENLINEAAINAAKNKSGYISLKDIDNAYYTIVAGSPKKEGVSHEKQITAYHEAGHGLVSKFVTPENTVGKITIIPSTKGAGGFCISIPPEKMYYTKKDIESKIMVDLAGRAAEEIIFGSDCVTTGAANDIEKATALIKDYVMKYGMSEKTGLLNMSQFKEQVDLPIECADHMQRLYDNTKKLLNDNLNKLTAVATLLLDKETISEKELERVI